MERHPTNPSGFPGTYLYPRQAPCPTTNRPGLKAGQDGHRNRPGTTGEVKEQRVRKPTSHGDSRTFAGEVPEYRAWESMKSRCLNPKHRRYAQYGGRGITICEAWRTSGIDARIVRNRLSYGWPVDRALTARVRPHVRRAA